MQDSNLVKREEERIEEQTISASNSDVSTHPIPKTLIEEKTAAATRESNEENEEPVPVSRKRSRKKHHILISDDEDETKKGPFDWLYISN